MQDQEIFDTIIILDKNKGGETMDVLLILAVVIVLLAIVISHDTKNNQIKGGRKPRDKQDYMDYIIFKAFTNDEK